ncbi:hypothetical protein TNIN_235661 [Trichonephila inaurata madagascariensis]|uniref:Uncharacterized protein n=1 Tax=Trichonephila inaurata madagascariensis TaxID=2747483 RepID=A0A8X7C0C4_9ARAC|nr:hypothetical protein TNIN_235661 [Trichonephila inaurata madagascariensis]
MKQKEMRVFAHAVSSHPDRASRGCAHLRFWRRGGRSIVHIPGWLFALDESDPLDDAHGSPTSARSLPEGCTALVVSMVTGYGKRECTASALYDR